MRICWVFARAGSAALLATPALLGSAYGETPDISGTYWASEYHPKIQIVGGGDLPLSIGAPRSHRAPCRWALEPQAWEGGCLGNKGRQLTGHITARWSRGARCQSASISWMIAGK